jgi:hypothetical protein
MRQTHSIQNPLASISTQHQLPIEVTLDFPLYRKNVQSDNWRKDITLVRIAEDGSSLSLRYIKASQNDQETVEFTKGRIAVDTGNLDYTRGVGEHASSEQEFMAMVVLGTKLLAQFTQELGPLPVEAIDPLHAAVSSLSSRANGREQRSSALRAQ